MECLDSRRLTGPNLIQDEPGAIIDVRCDASERADLTASWREEARRFLDDVGWTDEQTATHDYPYGVSLAISAPIDALYAASELNDAAYESACRRLRGAAAVDTSSRVAELTRLIAQERNPRLIALQKAAAEHGALFLSDDDFASVGMGKSSQTWPVSELPDPGSVPWESIGRIPVGLVTGTNGKTTSVRMLAAMAAGHTVGTSSTEGLRIGTELLEAGDYSGPGGARNILRHERVDFAILETARGGLQRRGLGVSRADAALITNIAADHLGDFGVHDLEALADVKWVVTRALTEPDATLVINAGDPLLAARASGASCPVLRFSPDTEIAQQGGGPYVTVRDDLIVIGDGTEERSLVRVDAVPLTFGGAARHNIENALGAVGLARALGLTDEAIVSGLVGTEPNDIPGRGNLYRIGDVTVLVDFAHNPHGLRAVMDLAENLPVKRRLLSIGQAGDRPDDLIRELVSEAARFRADKILVKRYSKYARGRGEGEVANLIARSFVDTGVAADSIETFDDDLDATPAALAWARSGDLLLLLVLTDQDEVIEMLKRRVEHDPA
ncbi:MAG: Mur ligase family protein [Gammaproteobacteria bacterium]